MSEQAALHVFEATIESVDYENGVCSVRSITESTSSTTGVPLPNYGGKLDHGLYMRYATGTRVLCLRAPMLIGQQTSQASTVILSVFPFKSNYSVGAGGVRPVDEPGHIVGIPQFNQSDSEELGISLCLNGREGANLAFTNGGDVLLSSPDDTGYFCYSRDSGQTCFNSGHILISKSNSHNEIAGTAIRYFGSHRQKYENAEFFEHPLRLKYSQDTELGWKDIGMFHKDIPMDLTTFPRFPRNPRRSEYVLKINEYCEQSNFSGFDDESKMHSGTETLATASDTLSRDRKPGNCLRMHENELIEVIAGNLIDINGNILDINYNNVVLGASGYVYTESDDRPDNELYAIETKLKSRREIGYHFQLSTNTVSEEKSKSNSAANFIFDVDKEGVLKVNIPSSSDTGNVPFSSSANFVGSGDTISVSHANPSRIEPVPVSLWSNVITKKDEESGDVEGVRTVFGEARDVIYPNTLQTTRETGVLFSNNEREKYFPDTPSSVGADSIRVNITKYHNMYAAAERLIANTIQGFDFLTMPRPLEGVNPKGYQFEVRDDRKYGDDDTVTDDTKKIKNMSIMYVAPAKPAINPGGYISVAGNQRKSYPIYSNTFSTDTVEGKAKKERADFDNKATVSPGGRSASINLEGSIDMSIGQDHHDKKSMVLDMAGSMVAWFGKDRNGRSLILQTDGSVLVNVGGSYGVGDSSEYEGEGSEDTLSSVFNKGSLDIRVNVVDKGFVGKDPPKTGKNENPLSSDYLISISEQGLVIAGMHKGAPMIIRNDGNIHIESTNTLRLMSGDKIEFLEGSNKVARPSKDQQ
jgi:hypothetical protein